MTEREFEAGGHRFKLNKVPAMEQFHIVRRIGPLLSEVLPAMGRIKKAEVEGMTEDEKFEQFAQILAPLFAGLSKLSDKDADMLLIGLLCAVEIHQAQFNNWTRVAVREGIKIQDLELPVLMQAAGRALMYNLSGFLAIRPQK